MRKTYLVEGRIITDFKVEVEADSFHKAEQLAVESIHQSHEAFDDFEIEEVTIIGE